MEHAFTTLSRLLLHTPGKGVVDMYNLSKLCNSRYLAIESVILYKSV